MKKPILFLFLIVTFFIHPLISQASFGGQPLGLSSASFSKAIPTLEFQGPNVNKAKAEDEHSQANRFAAPVLVDIDPATKGRWTTTAAGTAIWQLSIKIPDAKGLLIFYEDFELPAEAKLFVYSPDGQQILGAYTQASQARGDRFMTGIIYGDEVLLEYQSPQIGTRTPFHIWRIDAAYKNISAEKDLLDFGFGASSPCHDNVACSTGDNWEAEQNAVARIIVVVDGGSGYCTGTLLNNTAQDGRLLFLSAFHCMDGYTPLYDLWRYDFYYSSSTCDSPIDEPDFRSVLGSDSLAGRRANDFLLLDIHPETAINMELHLAGWDRRAINPDSGAVVHHPLGDIQKISISSTESTVFPSSINWNNGVSTPPNHHFKTTYSDGTIEVGASGAALFNQDHRVVAQLQGSGTNITCDETFGYFGRLSMSWEGAGTPATRLKDWLDPLGTLPDTLDALGRLRAPTILTEAGEPIPDIFVAFYVDDELVGNSFSDDTGLLSIPDDIPSTGTLRMEFTKETMYKNGVTTADLIKISKHILRVDTLSPLRMLASDVNGSNSLTTLDIIKIRKLILTLADDFGTGGMASWQFFKDPFNPIDPLDPWPIGTRSNNFTFVMETGFRLPDFIGVKTGDASGNADPGL